MSGDYVICRAFVVRCERECCASAFRFSRSAYALIEISQTSQSHRVVWIDLTRCFVVMNRIVFATKSLEHLRRVQIAVQWTSGTRESSCKLHQTCRDGKGQTQIVQNSLVGWRQLRGSLQTIDRRAIVAVLIKREAEVVQCVRILGSIFTARSNESFARSPKPFLS